MWAFFNRQIQTGNEKIASKSLQNPRFPVEDERSREQIISESQGSEKTDPTRKA